jgi:uncharacterized membrane protein YhaH (DUF805 family)
VTLIAFNLIELQGDDLRDKPLNSAIGEDAGARPAFYLLGFPLLVIGVWLFAATAIKRLHDHDKSAWWLIPFFIAPSLLDRLWDWLDNPALGLVVSAFGFGLSLWCFVELFCLRGTKGPNRFGSDPLAPRGGCIRHSVTKL